MDPMGVGPCGKNPPFIQWSNGNADADYELHAMCLWVPEAMYHLGLEKRGSKNDGCKDAIWIHIYIYGTYIST